MVILNKEKIQDFISYAINHSSFWQERIEGKEFSDIPILRKMDLPEFQKGNPPFGNIATVSANKMARIFMSPGPIYDPQTSDGDFWHFSEALAAAGFGTGDIVINTFSYHLSPAGFMFDTALRELGATVIPAGVGNTELQAEILKNIDVTGFVGTPSFLNALLEKAESLGYFLGSDINLKKAFFTAEKLSDHLRLKWQEKGIGVYEGYGTADAGLIAYQDETSKGLKVTSHSYVEICEPETGKPVSGNDIGEIVISFFDKSYPLIRFGTGDLSSWTNGEEGKYLSGIHGRVGDGVKVKGMFVHLKQLSSALEEYPYIQYFQAVVDRINDRDSLTIYIEVDKDIQDFSIDKVQNKLKGVIRITPTIKLVEKALSREESQLLDKRKW